MTTYLMQRLLSALGTLVLTSIIVFSALLVIPGDPAQNILGMNAGPEALRVLHQELGLDRPPLERYVNWVGDVVTGDLGGSIRYRLPVTELIGDRLGLTVPLVFISLGLSVLISLILGSIAAGRAGSISDLLLSAFAVLGAAVPSFWLGLILILVFAVNLNWFPAGSFPGWGNLGPALWSLVLPVLTLVGIRTALITRMVRSSLLDVLSQDYVRTARAKGVNEFQILAIHALRNAMLPVITVIGLEFGALLTATVVVETVFDLPGLGTLALVAIEARDYPLVQGIILFLAAVIVGVNLIVDFLYALLDPRVSYG